MPCFSALLKMRKTRHILCPILNPIFTVAPTKKGGVAKNMFLQVTSLRRMPQSPIITGDCGIRRNDVVYRCIFLETSPKFETFY
jgi:hypothetical protein